MKLEKIGVQTGSTGVRMAAQKKKKTPAPGFQGESGAARLLGPQSSNGFTSASGLPTCKRSKHLLSRLCFAPRYREWPQCRAAATAWQAQYGKPGSPCTLREGIRIFVIVQIAMSVLTDEQPKFPSCSATPVTAGTTACIRKYMQTISHRNRPPSANPVGD